jgi:uncharacterized membrane protein HdeD (DUF308 family)
MRIRVVDADVLSRNWWVVLARGVAGVLFGIVTLLAPTLSFSALVLVFGAYALADGVLAIVSAIRRRGSSDHWWVLLLEGLASVAVGVLTILVPGITALTLLYVYAAWALVTGVLEIVAAIRLRQVITGEWLLVLSGVASVAFAVLLILFPGIGAITLMIWLGAYVLLFGALLIALAFRLRSRSHGMHAPPAAPRPA